MYNYVKKIMNVLLVWLITVVQFIFARPKSVFKCENRTIINEIMAIFVPIPLYVGASKGGWRGTKDREGKGTHETRDL